ncbi:hypothetical protein DV515_00013957 [Chloebia gouldiae]|uniref:Uncharacterized protein n=1 Tax=Chloebia gouldiae TaxID=44316 RepID=A0A3L8S0N7_CHLGU|nr:hypothetical protein DV515_00013957 [Chloebia gouldiae]
MPGVSFNSVYTQIWRVLLHLAADPYPDVSDLAMKVLNSIAYKHRDLQGKRLLLGLCPAVHVQGLCFGLHHLPWVASNKAF